MDIFDKASEIEERERNIALQFRKIEPIKPVGYCHYCNEPVKSGLFCCTDCRNDWTHEFETISKQFNV